MPNQDGESLTRGSSINRAGIAQTLITDEKYTVRLQFEKHCTEHAPSNRLTFISEYPGMAISGVSIERTQEPCAIGGTVSRTARKVCSAQDVRVPPEN